MIKWLNCLQGQYSWSRCNKHSVALNPSLEFLVSPIMVSEVLIDAIIKAQVGSLSFRSPIETGSDPIVGVS